MRNSFSVSTGRQPTTPRRPASNVPHNQRYLQPPPPVNQYNNRDYPRPDFPPPNRHSRDRLPSLSPASLRRLPRPNFIISLFSTTTSTNSNRKHEIETLTSNLNLPPGTLTFPTFGTVAAKLTFSQWTDALSTVVSLWDSRLRGSHGFLPKLISNVMVPSDAVEMREKLKEVFSAHVRELIVGGEAVKKLKTAIEEKSKEIAAICDSMKAKGLSIRAFDELNEKKKGLEAEREVIRRRLEEFEGAMRCVLRYLEGDDGNGEDDVEVFRLKGGYNWDRIYRLILRECRRLEDGLPIYSYRRDILRRIHGEQIMVLIGETGSGKSTQLVQFLADSGVAANEMIICTQPRKIAASSLAHRVREETNGCYESNSVMCCPTFSSSQKFDSKVVYMTDHCLLQHYMSDHNLSGVSCIVIDEAHERSLNTDLLLASLKDLLCRRVDLRLVIMSATANANQLSDYFFGCGIFHVSGRNFPVEVIYTPPDDTEGPSFSGGISSYVYDVVRMAVEVHKTHKDKSTILAFLTSQSEVEWACERFEAMSAIAVPLHGKLFVEEQFQVFQNIPGKRKVIFATNIAETSLTIPGVKYVIDSGMVKESKFEPGTGMNVLRVCRISQSSANQRAGRAGRTEPGRCYRLYSEHDFESMYLNQEPEIRRVHLGVAVLRILALGIKNIEGFDFVDAPSPEAIKMATQNLVQLGAIVEKNGIHELTVEGQYLVKMGLEPRLGKLILSCVKHHMGKEGLVLAAVMANSSSIFCRVGNYDDKLKADCLKVQFCDGNGDLFTLLSVYKEWESLPRERRNKWCWENSINAKSLRRCEDTVRELEICLQKELTLIIPTYWVWSPNKPSEHDKYLKRVILSSLVENVGMYTGYDHLGYEVALTGQHVKLHPSCSLNVFNQKPSWVVFGEILSVTNNEYLVCVTAFDFEALSSLDPPPLFDASEMENRRLHVKVMGSFGSTLLKRFCGKANSSLLSIVLRARSLCMDERIGIQVNFNQNEILIFASSLHMEKVSALVNDALEYEKKWLSNECIEKSLYRGWGTTPFALFGAGAEIKHLELGKQFLTVDVYHFDTGTFDDKELLMLLEEKVGGSICNVHKSISKQGDEQEKWGSVTFITPEAAVRATELQKLDLNGSVLKLFPSRTNFVANHKVPSFPSVKARISWPRKMSTGSGVIKCSPGDVHRVISEMSNLVIGENLVRLQEDRKSSDSVLIRGLDKTLSDVQILDILRKAARRDDLEFFLFRGDSVVNPSCGECEEALYKEIIPFMSERSAEPNCVQVEVLEPKPTDYFMRALITFDGRLHLEAAKALQALDGKVLRGCLPWQMIKCQQLFHSSLVCSASVYGVIRKQLDDLLECFAKRKGAEWRLDSTSNGSYRVKISANATKTIAEMRRSLEELMVGRQINHPSLTRSVLQHLFSRDGIDLMKRIQQETETYILFDRHNLNVRVFGSGEKSVMAEQKLVQSLVEYNETKQLEIRLRGAGLPPDLMKEVVKRFGPDLYGIKEKVPGVDLTLNARHHLISVHGDREMKQKVEEIVHEVARMKTDSAEIPNSEITCPICLCEVEEGYRLEGCRHLFCKSCLMEQFESAVRNIDSFPMRCAHDACRSPILLTDLKILLSQEKLDDLFRASLSSFVVSSGKKFRFCPSPNCPSVYRVADPGRPGELFVCGACRVETCTKCHLEYHPYLSCEKYQEFKEDPDLSLKDWCRGKENVKTCPVCGYTIEKGDGCNHVECRCGRHICWVCLEFFSKSDTCYEHLRAVHNGIQ